MKRLREGLFGLVLGLALLNGVASRRINTTIYDTNTARVTYTPHDDFCVRWSNHIFWKTCDEWAKPWQSEVYRSQGKLLTLHRSLDHEQPALTIKFQGSAIWLYGPPRNQLPAIPVDHKICLHENHRVASSIVCYRVDVAEAYSLAEDYNTPVVIFAKGGLRDQEHQIVVSVSDPIGEVDKHRGIQFSHAVCTIKRPTPWPIDEDDWRFRKIVLHDTHPLLSYSPLSPDQLSWAPDPSGWHSKAYTTEDGSRASWHELRSRGESNQDKWGVDTTITAGVVALYGIPKAHVAATDSLSDVCVRVDSGPCEVVDVKRAYLNTERRDEAVLLWKHQALDPYQQTRISVRLVKTGGDELKVFPFKAINYYEPQEYSSPDPPVGRLENIVLAHDNQSITYHPERRCVRYFEWWCAEWFDPWTWKEAGPSSSVVTYRSTVSSYRKTEDPSITLDFQGSAVYVYGAPKSFMESGFASQHACINDVCHIVDTEQAYLNAPEAPLGSASTSSPQLLSSSNAMTSPFHPELEPVLIWSMTGLDDQVQHSLRLALAGLPSKDDAEMTIAQVVYTKVTYEAGQKRPDTPIPQPDYSYEGPMYPPYATKWEPRPPSPNPTPQPPLPPPRQGYSVLALILWSMFGAIALFFIFVLAVGCCSVPSPETRRVLPDPPPPYPGPPRPAPRPAPRPPQPAPPPPRPKLSPPRPNPPQPEPAPLPPPPPPPPTYEDRKPKPKPDFFGPDPIPAPNPPIDSEEYNPSPKDQNNAGPCPGTNIASPRPEYTESTQKQPSNSSRRTTHSSSSILPSVTPSPSLSRNAATPIPDYRSDRSASLVPSSSALTTPSYTNMISQPIASSRSPLNHTTRQPTYNIRPTPEVPPKPNPVSPTIGVAASAWAPSTTNATTSRSERVVRPTPTPTITGAPRTQVAPNPPQVLTTPQSQYQSTPTASRVELPSSRPQEHAYTSDLDEWARARGFRIDRLMDAAARNDHARPRTRVRDREQGRNAMPPFDPDAHDTPDRGNADPRVQRHTVEETSQLPPIDARVGQGDTPPTRRGRGRRGQGRGTNSNANPNSVRARTENTHPVQGSREDQTRAPAGFGARRPRANNRNTSLPS